MDKPEVVTAPGTVPPPPRLQLAPPPKSIARKVRILQSTRLSGESGERTIHEPELVKPAPEPPVEPAAANAAGDAQSGTPPPPGSTLPVPATTKEEMPILAAFQAFLEGERRRTRNRMLAWGASLAAVLLVILTLAARVGMSHFRQVDADFSELQTELAAIRDSAGTGEQLQDDVQSLATETQSLEEELGRKDAAIATVRKELSSRAKQLSTQISGMKTAVDSLKAENQTLKKEVELARQAAAIAAAQPVLPALPVYPVVPAAPLPPVPTRTGVTLEFTLARPAPAAAIPWRVAVTE